MRIRWLSVSIWICFLFRGCPSRPYDVDFGTMNGASLLGKTDILPALSDALRQEGLENLSNNYFPAAKNQTITKYASGLGVPTVQLEINSTWLTPAQDNLSAHRFSQLLQALTRFIRRRTNNPTGICQPSKTRPGSRTVSPP